MGFKIGFGRETMMKTTCSKGLDTDISKGTRLQWEKMVKVGVKVHAIPNA